MVNHRIEAFQRILADNGLDGALFAPSSAMQYLLDDTGYHWQRTMHTGGPVEMGGKNRSGHFLNIPDCILYIPKNGDPVLSMSYERAKDMEHLPYQKEVGYYSQINGMLKGYVHGGRIACGESCRWYLEEFLGEVSSKPQAADAEPFVERMRMIKEPKEIAALRKVAAFTDEAMAKIVPLIRPGITSFQMQIRMADLAKEAGLADLSFPPAALYTKTDAPGSEILFSHPDDVPLTEGCSVGFDYGYMIDGYVSDYGRSFYCGKAPQAIEDGYHALQEAQCRMLASLRPGEPMKIIIDRLQQEMDRLGYGRYLRRDDKWSIMGHQIGIDVHERPWIHCFQEETLKPGMVMCIEPKLWWPGKCYLRCEDMVLITENGAESLTTFDRELFSLIP